MALTPLTQDEKEEILQCISNGSLDTIENQLTSSDLTPQRAGFIQKALVDRYEVCKTLIKSPSTRYAFILDLAVHMGLIEIIRSLLSSQAVCQAEKDTLLLEGCMRGYLDVVTAGLEAGSNPNFNGMTPLLGVISPLCAVATLKKEHSAAIAHALILKGANVNEENVYQATPLLVAIAQNNVPVIRVLLSARADLTTKNNKGENAIEMASSSRRPNHQEVLGMLLAHQDKQELEASVPKRPEASQSHPSTSLKM